MSMIAAAAAVVVVVATLSSLGLQVLLLVNNGAVVSAFTTIPTINNYGGSRHTRHKWHHHRHHSSSSSSSSRAAVITKEEEEVSQTELSLVEEQSTQTTTKTTSATANTKKENDNNNSNSNSNNDNNIINDNDDFKSFSDLSSSFQELYERLENNARIYVQKTPTIKFSLVETTKPTSTTTSTTASTTVAASSTTTTPTTTTLDHYNMTAVLEHVRRSTTTNTTSPSLPPPPVLLYLPGLDCVGISAIEQFDDLSRNFETWRLSVSTVDRTSLKELIGHVVQFINELSNQSNHGGEGEGPTRRRVILVGESFGGLLAPLVALQLQQQQQQNGMNVQDDDLPSSSTTTMTTPILQGMVLVNPATSFGNTNWDQLGPLLYTLKAFGEPSPTTNPITPYTVLGGTVLSTLVPDRTQITKVGEMILKLSNPFNNRNNNIMEIISDVQTAMVEGFGSLAKTLPPDLVLHRVRDWLLVGSQILTEQRLKSLTVPTLVVAGSQDVFLPSNDEVKRLEKLLPNISKPSLVIEDAGHLVLDNRVNLTEAIMYNVDMDPFNLLIPNYDPIKDWKLPPPNQVQQTIDNQVQPLRRLTSPVFFSTDPNGKRHKGLGQIPYLDQQQAGDPPLIIVANHQLFGIDLGMVLAELYEQRGIWARGLAHPVVTSRRDKTIEMPDRPLSPGVGKKPTNRGNASPNDPSTFQRYGAVMVTPRNYYKLLQTGQNVLLFPGGVREVFHGKDEAYQLFWPESPDFVRTAARFNATIVPLAGIGAADSVDILVDGPDMTKLPFGIGDRIRESSSNTTSARFDTSNDDELFVPPFFVPKLPPARHYFCFGKPFSLTDINPKDIRQCESIYKDIKTELERGLDDLQSAREFDPYQDSTRRLTVEQITGKQAPTFPVETLNQK